MINILFLWITNGDGYSKYKDILINKFKPLSDEMQGINFFIKNIKNNRIWTSNYAKYLPKPDKYEISFSEDMCKIKRQDGAIETITKTCIAQEEPVEIRNIEIKNNGVEEETLEVTSYLEPVLSKEIQDYAHPAFNKLFLSVKYLENDILLVKRKGRLKDEKDFFMAVALYTDEETGNSLEYEIDKEKFVGRDNLNLPHMVEHSKTFSKNTELSLDTIVALKRTIKIKPEDKCDLSLILSVEEDEERAIENIKKYLIKDNIEKSFELARARVEAEARYLGLNYKDIETYQKMLGYILKQNPLKKLYLDKMPLDKNYEQSQLWKYGISGDLPILLVKLDGINDIYVLNEVLKAYEFFRVKNIQVDLVIFDEEENNYEKYVKEEIINSILNKNLNYMQNQKGGIFIIEDDEVKDLLCFRANLVIDAKKGDLKQQLMDLEEELLDKEKSINNETAKVQATESEQLPIPLDTERLKFYNEYGGFSEDGKEYIIKINKQNKLPTVWSHIISNGNFGTIVTESMGGFTWCGNSRLNRLTAWSNDQVVDTPSEVIYLQDRDNLKTWSITLNPMPDDNDYVVTYGFGYAKYNHVSMGVDQKLSVFIPNQDNVKVNLLRLKNITSKKKRLKLVYYIKPVIGEDEISSNGYLDLSFRQNSNTIIIKNMVDNKEQYAYILCSEEIKSYTGNRNFFFGDGNLSNPEALKKVSLDNQNSLGIDNIIAIQIDIDLEAYESRDISIALGMEESMLVCLDKAYQYSNIPKCLNELENVKKYWEDKAGQLKVNTPLESMNILLNGWLMYQSLVCRIWARSGFYQSGGAFGFRDQLQDTLGLKFYDSLIMKNQIIKHANHQFIEGDVQHWWHDENSMGIRTRFTDDLLWLVYLVNEYISFTGDFSILNIEVQYKSGDILENGIDERYCVYENSEVKENIFLHCIRAIDKTFSNFGEHNLPKMGSGDWNDGFSTVGNKGKGESVWLGFFFYDIVNKFIPIMEKYLENKNVTHTVMDEIIIGKDPIILEKKLKKYKENLEKLKKSLNIVAWDGRWYKRAFTDDGDELGTLQNDECKIDSISQSWAVISGAGDNDKKYISMEALENHLIDKENGIIKLLDPPFEKSRLEPGYIKAYMPGIRENGGQYTHRSNLVYYS